MVKLLPLISEKKIQAEVKKLGKNISKDYKNKDLVLVGVLKGSFVFLADLTQQITIDHSIDFIGASSYEGVNSTGKVIFTKQPDLELKGRDILLVEDIVDTGNTLKKIVEFMILLDVSSVKVCALINKFDRRKVDVVVDYPCFSLEEGFVVGYGLDYDEKFRNLPALYDLKL